MADIATSVPGTPVTLSSAICTVSLPNGPLGLVPQPPSALPVAATDSSTVTVPLPLISAAAQLASDPGLPRILMPFINSLIVTLPLALQSPAQKPPPATMTAPSMPSV